MQIAEKLVGLSNDLSTSLVLTFSRTGAEGSALEGRLDTFALLSASLPTPTVNEFIARL